MPPQTNKPQAMTNYLVTSCLLVFYFLFILYETVIPFRLETVRAGLQRNLARAEVIPFLNHEFGRLSFGDVLGNIFFFIPLGFFLYHWRRARRDESPEEKLTLGALLAAAGFYSLAIEFLQLFLDKRISSINDVMMNSTGAYLGLRLARLYPDFVTLAINQSQRLARARPVFVCWIALILVQTLGALAPFDFSLKLESLQRQLQRWEYSWQVLPEFWRGPSIGQSLSQHFPHQAHLTFTLFTTALLALLLGALTVFCCQYYWRRTPRLFWGSLILSAILYPALTAAQFIVQSAHPYIFFPLLSLSGVLIGILLMTMALPLLRLMVKCA